MQTQLSIQSKRALKRPKSDEFQYTKARLQCIKMNLKCHVKHFSKRTIIAQGQQQNQLTAKQISFIVNLPVEWIFHKLLIGPKQINHLY